MIRHSTQSFVSTARWSAVSPLPSGRPAEAPWQQDADGVRAARPRPRSPARHRPPPRRAPAAPSSAGRARRPTRHAGVREERRARGLSVQFDRVGRAARREPLLATSILPSRAASATSSSGTGRPPAPPSAARRCASAARRRARGRRRPEEATLEPKWGCNGTPGGYCCMGTWTTGAAPGGAYGTNGAPMPTGGGAGWAGWASSPGWSIDIDVRHRDPRPWVGLFDLEPGLSVRLRLLGHEIGCPSFFFGWRYQLRLTGMLSSIGRSAPRPIEKCDRGSPHGSSDR